MVVTAGEGRSSPPKSPPRPQRRLYDFDFPTDSWDTDSILRNLSLISSAESEAPESSLTSTLTSQRPDSPGEEISHQTKSFAGDRDLKKAEGRGADEAGTGRSSSFIAGAADAPANLRSQKAVCNAGSEEGQQFSISLSPEEIEQDIRDIRALMDRTPPRSAKKRPRTIQRHLDSIFPGLRLGDITPEEYKVDEKKSSF